MKNIIAFALAAAFVLFVGLPLTGYTIDSFGEFALALLVTWLITIALLAIWNRLTGGNATSRDELEIQRGIVFQAPSGRNCRPHSSRMCAR